MFDTRDIASNTDGEPLQASKAPRGRAFNNDILLESLVCDMHWTSFHAATICYVIHASLAKNLDLRLGAWRHLLYDNTRISQLGLRYCEQLDIPVAAQKALDTFFVAQSKALNAASRAISGPQAHANLTRSQLSPLRALWIETAQQALRALQQMASATHSRIPKEYNDNVRVLSGFLNEAISGQTDRMNQWGEITLPTLAQRRQEPRARTGQPCQVLSSEGAVAAQLMNASRHGLGISCDMIFQTGEHLTIELADGRQLDGTVARSHGRSFGLRLSHVLSASDPLFMPG